MKYGFISENEELMKEWNWEKNNSLGIFPDKIRRGSTRRVWWKCHKCLNEWVTTPNCRTSTVAPTNCPKCAKIIRVENKLFNLRNKSNIKMKYPELLEEWDYGKNTILPELITKGSHEKIWWKCKYGHSWKTAVSGRIRGNGCPYCSGRFAIKGVNDVKTINPILAKEWDYEKNKNLRPEDFTYGSTKKVWWKCKFGHEWKASICNRHKKRGCPICSKYRHISLPEKTIHYYFSRKFKIEENIKINNQMEIDLYIPDLCLGIEYDGRAWHKNINRDINKDRFCEINGIKLIRVREDGLPEYETGMYLIKTKKPESNLIYMESVLKEIQNYININYNLSEDIDFNIERDYYSILASVERFEMENSLSNQFPDLINEWNYSKNGELRPDMISKGSSRKVWWVCKNGHEWRTSISNRTNKDNQNKCPYCQRKKTVVGVNDIVSLNFDFLIDWNYEKNIISPSELMENSGKVVWWKCHKCGNEWQTNIATRKKHGCKFCSRRKYLDSVTKRVKNIETGEIFKSAREAGEKYNIKPNFINRVCFGKRKMTGGYHWKYVDEKKD